MYVHIYIYVILDTFKIGVFFIFTSIYNKTLAWGEKIRTSGPPSQILVGVTLVFYRDNGKENGNYYNGDISGLRA